MSSEAADRPTGSTIKKSSISTGQVTALVVLLFVAFISGGYYFGTQLNFSKLDNPQSDGGIGSLFAGMQSGNLKKWYWIHTKGWERAGYIVTVAINGQTVDKFSKPDVSVDVSKLVRLGKNSITYTAKSLPLDQRSDTQSAYLTVELMETPKKENEKIEDFKFENGDLLVDYRREVTDTEDFNDTKTFEIVE